MSKGKVNPLKTPKKFASSLRLIANHTKDTIDADGVLLESYDVKSYQVSLHKDQFAMYYGRLITDFVDGLYPLDIVVFLALALKAEYGSGNIRVDNMLIDEIAKQRGSSIAYIRNCVSRLSKTGLLLKHPTYKRGIYRINPEFAWFGEANDRKKAVKLLMIEDLHEGNRDFDFEIEYKDKLKEKAEDDNLYN